MNAKQNREPKGPKHRKPKQLQEPHERAGRHLAVREMPKWRLAVIGAATVAMATGLALMHTSQNGPPETKKLLTPVTGRAFPMPGGSGTGVETTRPESPSGANITREKGRLKSSSLAAARSIINGLTLSGQAREYTDADMNGYPGMASPRPNGAKPNGVFYVGNPYSPSGSNSFVAWDRDSRTMTVDAWNQSKTGGYEVSARFAVRGNDAKALNRGASDGTLEISAFEAALKRPADMSVTDVQVQPKGSSNNTWLSVDNVGNLSVQVLPAEINSSSPEPVSPSPTITNEDVYAAVDPVIGDMAATTKVLEGSS